MRFEDLEVWKASARLSSEVYLYFSELRDFAYRDQITRSGLSVPSNIAEGFERGMGRDRIRFLRIAKGSCGELRTQIFIGMSIGYIDEDRGKDWIGQTRRVTAMLHGLIEKLDTGISEAV